MSPVDNLAKAILDGRLRVEVIHEFATGDVVRSVVYVEVLPEDDDR